MAEQDRVRYPIGKFAYSGPMNANDRAHAIDQIAALPAELRKTVQGIDEHVWSRPYRDGGWSSRQLVHHIADSHINAYVRTKMAATQSSPAIMAYDQEVWAELGDVRSTPPSVSLDLIEAIHRRWSDFLRSLDHASFQRTFRHPEHKGELTLDWLVAMYSWHGRHHMGHIRQALERG